MQLYYFEAMNPRKACALARHLDAPVEYVLLDVRRGEHRTPAFLALNPNGRAPVLVDGDVVMWESNAIMCHLAARAGSDLWPGDLVRQIEVIRWLSWDLAHFSRHGGALYFEHVIRPQFGLGAPEAAMVDEATEAFRRSASVLEGHLATRRHVVGDGMTVADFALAAALPYAAPARLPLAECPAIRRWYAQLEALPAWRDPFPATASAA